MISLSKVIKSTETSLTRAKVIEILQVSFDEVKDQRDIHLSDIITAEQTFETSFLSEQLEQQKRLMQETLEHEKKVLAAEYEQLKQQLLAEQAKQLEKATQQGYAAGYQTGEQTVRQEFQAMIVQAQNILQQVQTERLQFLAENEPFMIELVCEIAKRVIDRQLQVAPDLLVPIVKQALQEIQDLQRVEVRVHPDDYEYVFQAKHSLIPSVPGQSELYVIPDIHVANGGCVIHTEFGTVDARIDTQLNEIKRVLVNVARGSVS